MSTDICPACGYPTLSPALCAFCRPGDVFGGGQIFAATLSRGPELAGSWSNPVAS